MLLVVSWFSLLWYPSQGGDLPCNQISFSLNRVLDFYASLSIEGEIDLKYGCYMWECLLVAIWAKAV